MDILVFPFHKNYSPLKKILLRVETNNKGVDFDFPETVLYLQPWKDNPLMFMA